jgi:hypothetical protein
MVCRSACYQNDQQTGKFAALVAKMLTARLSAKRQQSPLLPVKRYRPGRARLGDVGETGVSSLSLWSATSWDTAGEFRKCSGWPRAPEEQNVYSNQRHILPQLRRSHSCRWGDTQKP